MIRSIAIHAREVREDRISHTLSVMTGHFTDVFVCTHDDGGLSIARSSIVEMSDSRISGEIRFDWFLAEAHRRGIRVHAWISPGLWPEYLQAPLPSTWNCRELEGIDRDWLNFSVPEARSLVASVAAELCNLYPTLDGIWLDHIRYYAYWIDQYPSLSAEDITETVRLVRQAASGIQLAAYVGWEEARSHVVGQYWWDWLDGGLVDRVVAGTYAYPDEIPAVLDELIATHGLHGLLASIHVMPDNVDTPLSEEEFLWEVEAIEERGFEGWNLFSMSWLRKAAAHLIPVLPEAIARVQRVATWTTGQGPAILLEVDDQVLQILRDLPPTATEIKAAIDGLALAAGVQLPLVFVHINRDASLAMATGAEPEVWPEDEPEPGEL